MNQILNKKMSKKHFEIGDRVEAIDQDFKGVVVEIKLPNTVQIMTPDGFELPFRFEELIKVSNDISKTDMAHSMLSSRQKEADQIQIKSKLSRKRPKTTPPMEVDLHIEKLTNKPKGLSNYEILELQLTTAKRRLEFAFAKRISRIVFIHGVGQGVLRAELEFLLNKYEDIRYSDADYVKYGMGALEVNILQKGFSLL